MIKNISNVRGIKCWGAHIGIKSKRRDLAMIYSTEPADAAAVFTKNVVVAEPIKISREHIKHGKVQCIVVNSGNANACTGKQGRQGALAMVDAAATALNIPPETVLVASTGLIGAEFPTEKVVKGIKHNIPKLSSRKIAGSFTANAILTTDTFAKEAYTSFKIGNRDINMAGVAKGSGMIHPNMGTMLAYVCCDVAISQPLLEEALREVVDKTFNMITIDGDTSTNDMAAIICNGTARNNKISRKGKNYNKFKQHLEKICTHLAKLIVSDGEGATKFIEYKVRGTKSNEDARKIVRTMSDSNLIKTAIFGRDPNWGRILAAAGRAGVDFDPGKIDLYIGTKNHVQIVKNGQPCNENKSIKRKMRANVIRITLDLKQGKKEAIGWGSDLSYEYVRINAEYTT